MREVSEILQYGKVGLFNSVIEECIAMIMCKQFKLYLAILCYIFVTPTLLILKADSETDLDLGVSSGVPQMSGFVFIEGRYLRPPYTVTRKGDSIFINRQFVEKQTSWSKANSTAKKDVVAVNLMGELNQSNVTAVLSNTVISNLDVQTNKVTPVMNVNDLFNDAKTNTALLVNADVDTNKVTESEVKTSPKERTFTKEELELAKASIIGQLEHVRKNYEIALGQDEIFFFGQSHNRLNGNYGTARILMNVLPKALRNAKSPSDLMERLNQGGIYFVDMKLCVKLFKNRTTFPLLEARLLKIKEVEAREALKKKAAKDW